MIKQLEIFQKSDLKEKVTIFLKLQEVFGLTCVIQTLLIGYCLKSRIEFQIIFSKQRKFKYLLLFIF